MSRVIILACAAGLVLAACQKQEPVQTREISSATTESPAKPAEPSTPPPETQRPTPPPTFAGSHILVAYEGAMRSKVQRPKAEALELAKKLVDQARKNPEGFADLARKHSDGPSGPKGGSLGSWTKGRMVPAFDQAIEKMKVGEISDPVETPFGFHVIKREAPPPTFSGAHILIAYKGAMRARPNVTRTKQEAQKLAAELAAQAKKDPSKFADLAREHSNGPSGPRGGDLGTWPKGRMVPAFDQAIEKLEVGGISDPVETPFGFHVIMRKAAPQ